MAAITEIPPIVVGRLPLYLRALNQIAAEGQEITSSHELGNRIGISSAQIRKDLSHFGEFGKQGTGYQVGHLRSQLQHILRVDHEWPVAIVGAGDLGHAIVRYGGFVDRGFRIVAVFDNHPAKIGQDLNGLKVQDMNRIPVLIRQQKIEIAMIAVPALQAQSVADTLVEAGVRAILNYAPISLNVPPKVQVQHIDPVTHLQRMTFYLE